MDSRGAVEDGKWIIQIKDSSIPFRLGGRTSRKRYADGLLLVTLLLLNGLNPPFLLGFELVVEEEESLFVVLG